MSGNGMAYRLRLLPPTTITALNLKPSRVDLSTPGLRFDYLPLPHATLHWRLPAPTATPRRVSSGSYAHTTPLPHRHHSQRQDQPEALRCPSPLISRRPAQIRARPSLLRYHPPSLARIPLSLTNVNPPLGAVIMPSLILASSSPRTAKIRLAVLADAAPLFVGLRTNGPRLVASSSHASPPPISTPSTPNQSHQPLIPRTATPFHAVDDLLVIHRVLVFCIRRGCASTQLRPCAIIELIAGLPRMKGELRAFFNDCTTLTISFNPFFFSFTRGHSLAFVLPSRPRLSFPRALTSRAYLLPPAIADAPSSLLLPRQSVSPPPSRHIPPSLLPSPDHFPRTDLSSPRGRPSFALPLRLSTFSTHLEASRPPTYETDDLAAQMGGLNTGSAHVYRPSPAHKRCPLSPRSHISSPLFVPSVGAQAALDAARATTASSSTSFAPLKTLGAREFAVRAAADGGAFPPAALP
ncbi:hypothetical protein DFH09DRAFT_1362702, partial [Mycena vulgaris]